MKAEAYAKSLSAAKRFLPVTEQREGSVIPFESQTQVNSGVSATQNTFVEKIAILSQCFPIASQREARDPAKVTVKILLF